MANEPTVNFVREIMAFDYSIAGKLTKGPIALWYALFNEFNRNGYAQWFPVSISWLQSHSGLSAAAVYKARNVLKQEGLIDFRKGKTKKHFANYQITLLVEGDYYSKFGIEKSKDKSIEKSRGKSRTDINNKLRNISSVCNSAPAREKNDVVIPIFKMGGGRK